MHTSASQDKTVIQRKKKKKFFLEMLPSRSCGHGNPEASVSIEIFSPDALFQPRVPNTWTTLQVYPMLSDSTCPRPALHLATLPPLSFLHHSHLPPSPAAPSLPPSLLSLGLRIPSLSARCCGRHLSATRFLLCLTSPTTAKNISNHIIAGSVCLRARACARVPHSLSLSKLGQARSSLRDYRTVWESHW